MVESFGKATPGLAGGALLQPGGTGGFRYKKLGSSPIERREATIYFFPARDFCATFPMRANTVYFRGRMSMADTARNGGVSLNKAEAVAVNSHVV